MKTSTQKNHAAQGDKGVDRNEVSAIGTKVPGVTSECMKCSYKKCPGNDSIDPTSCVGPGCSKTLHLSCFNLIHSKTSWLDKNEVGDHIVCTKTCWNKYSLSQTRKPTWSNDGANGPEDPMTSEKVLLDWMMKEGNYSKKWRGKDSKGKKKKHIAAEIAQLMNSAKVKVVRDGKQVMNKISHLEKSFRCAHDFANSETGQGLKDSNWGEFDEAVKSKCPFYFDLLEIFGDRASAKPKATSNDDLDSSGPEESDDVDIFSIEMSSIGGDEVGNEEGFDDDEDDVNEGTNNGYVTEKNTDRVGQSSQANAKVASGEGERKRKALASPSPSLVGNAASTKKGKNITLFDTSTSDSLALLAAAQRKLAQAKLDQIKKTDEEMDLKLRMQKFQMLHDIREKNPSLTKEQIVAMFPTLSDFVDIMDI